LAILFVACKGNSIESDAKKLADLQCRMLEFVKKSNAGDASLLKESISLSAEFQKMDKELKDKYTSEEDNVKFMQIYLKESEKCKQ
jgi:hypothetical protein